MIPAPVLRGKGGGGGGGGEVVSFIVTVKKYSNNESDFNFIDINGRAVYSHCLTNLLYIL